MSIPTKGEEFSKLIEHLRLAQESAAMIGHLERDASALNAKGWLGISELLKRAQYMVTEFANKGLQ